MISSSVIDNTAKEKMLKLIHNGQYGECVRTMNSLLLLQDQNILFSLKDEILDALREKEIIDDTARQCCGPDCCGNDCCIYGCGGVICFGTCVFACFGGECGNTILDVTCGWIFPLMEKVLTWCCCECWSC